MKDDVRRFLANFRGPEEVFYNQKRRGTEEGKAGVRTRQKFLRTRAMRRKLPRRGAGWLSPLGSRVLWAPGTQLHREPDWPGCSPASPVSSA